MALTDDDIREILRIIDESDLDELSIDTEGFSLHVRKGRVEERARPERTAARSLSDRALSSTAPFSTASSSTAAPAEPPPDDGLVTIPSPMLGTFYRAESPGSAAFVEVGSTLEPDTTVCIIEVMKMMNSVPAGVSGVIAEIVPENGQLVEYGEPLFRVTPAE
jgi:acetyl-CoA carboxylase biotin carboxyl carrier protein